MPPSNRLTQAYRKLEFLPDRLQVSLFSYLFGLKVPFKSTAGVVIESIKDDEAVLTLSNRRKAQNHLGQVHASAMCLLAETATGILVGWNLPDQSLPLMKSMKLKFIRRSTGDMRAVARLDEAQIASMRESPKGDTLVEVKLTDELGEEPALCEMVWAWVPKR